MDVEAELAEEVDMEIPSEEIKRDDKPSESFFEKVENEIRASPAK
jgi:hypothetical protein